MPTRLPTLPSDKARIDSFSFITSLFLLSQHKYQPERRKPRNRAFTNRQMSRLESEARKKEEWSVKGRKSSKEFPSERESGVFQLKRKDQRMIFEFELNKERARGKRQSPFYTSQGVIRYPRCLTCSILNHPRSGSGGEEYLSSSRVSIKAENFLKVFLSTCYL